MAWESAGKRLGQFTAAADYSSSSAQFTLVTPTAATVLTQTSTEGVFCIGVLQNRPSSGEMCQVEVMAGAVTKVRVSATAAAVAVGDKLRCTAAAGVETIGDALSSYVIGRAIEVATTSDNGLITMLITHEGAGSTAL